MQDIDPRAPNYDPTASKQLAMKICVRINADAVMIRDGKIMIVDYKCNHRFNSNLEDRDYEEN